MSWLKQTLSNTVADKLNQLSGQIKDILTDEPDESINEENIVNEADIREAKESDQQDSVIELLKSECSRWKEESRELSMRCHSLEALLEQKNLEFTHQIEIKNKEIESLKEKVSTEPSTPRAAEEYNHSEELDTSTDIERYSQLERTVSALREENAHLVDRNKELNKLIKILEQNDLVNKSRLAETESSSSAKSVEDIDRSDSDKLVANLRHELEHTKSLNASLNDQCDYLLREMELQKRLMDELNGQIDELKSTIGFALEVQKQEQEHSSLIESLSDKNDSDLAAMNQKSSEEAAQIEKLKAELSRLRNHLIEVSETFNKEAIMAEEREKELRNELSEARTLLKSSISQSNIPNEELEQELKSLQQSYKETMIENLSLKSGLSKANETSQHQQKVIKNLELLLERLQKDRDSTNDFQVKQLQRVIDEKTRLISDLQDQLKIEQEVRAKELANQINESKLHKDLEFKDKLIENLEKKILQNAQHVDRLNKELAESKETQKQYIEKDIIKNLLIGYFKLQHQGERKEVLNLLTKVLSFSETELEIINSKSGSFQLRNLLKRTSTGGGGAGAASTDDTGDTLNNSFAQLLIQYVEKQTEPK